jgi:hypothetical protein
MNYQKYKDADALREQPSAWQRQKGTDDAIEA